MRIACLAVLLAFVVPAAEAADDPTFNGVASLVSCYVRTILVCDGDFCTQPVPTYIGGWGGTLKLDFAGGRYEFHSEWKPLQVSKQSAAELNKPLWLQFQIQDHDQPLNTMLTLQPTPQGTYAISAVGSARISGPAKQVFALETFECQREP